jgi:hypothetical protein
MVLREAARNVLVIAKQDAAEAPQDSIDAGDRKRSDVQYGRAI